MAQNMNISVIKPNGEHLLINLKEDESFAEFQQRVLKQYHIHLQIDNFAFIFPTLTLNDNLCHNLKEYFVQTNHENGISDSDNITQILEINLMDKPNNIVKNEKNYVYPINEESIENNYQDQNIDNSLIVLNENIFEPTTFQSNSITDTKANHETVFKTNEMLLINNCHKTVQNSSKDRNLTTKNVNNTENINSNIQTYNYMDIESKLREIHDYVDENITDICRLCAGNVNATIKVEIYNENDDLEEKINKCLPIKVRKEDGLPQQLCEDCTNRIKNYYDFLQIVVEADKVLQLKYVNSESINENAVPEFMSDYAKSSHINKIVSNTINNKKIKLEPNETENSDFETEYLEVEQTEHESQNCRICDLAIENVEDAISHCITEHFINNLYACIFCEYGYETTDDLSNHIIKEHQNFDLRKNRRFQCSICSKKYGTEYQLEKHTCVKLTSNKSLHCEVCNQSFPTKVRLNFHRQFHLKESRPLFCSLCNIKFDDENEYFDHVNFIHDSKPIFPCEICDRTFTIRSALKNHQKVHSGIRNHKCELCDKSFLDKQTLREHEVCHMETKPYQCHVCGKNLNRLSRLRRHLLTHASNPVVNDVHVCNLCEEVLADQQTAEAHRNCQHGNQECIAIISTDKVFRCEFCEKCYSSPNSLNEHRNEHSGPTPFTCHICKAQFSSYSRCTTHKTTHGLYKDDAEKDNFPVVKHFLCENCGKSYLHWSYLALHRRLKHSNNAHIYKCSECNEEFPTSWAIAYHRKTKHNQDQQYKCNDCGKILANYHSLKIHKLNQHSDKKNKDLQCQKCGKCFVQQSSLEAHLKLHQGIKEYKCTLCVKKFVHSSGLSNHLKLHKLKKHGTNADQSDTESKLAENIFHRTYSERSFSCDICGLMFRRQFSLKSHRKKHVEQVNDAGNFVLMVDMKEDEEEEETENEVSGNNDASATMQLVQTVLENKPTVEENSYIQLQTGNELTENYIDIGNGNYLQVHGNTFNIDGKEYILVEENNKTSVARNEEFEMIVDETLREDGIAIDANNLINGQQLTNLTDNTVMLVNSDNSFIVNQNLNDIQSDYVFTTTEKAIGAKTMTNGSTYVIENQFMLENEDPNNF